MSNENLCDTCEIHSCENPREEYTCWLDMEPTQDVQDLWAYVVQKYLKENPDRERGGSNLPE